MWKYFIHWITDTIIILKVLTTNCQSNCFCIWNFMLSTLKFDILLHYTSLRTNLKVWKKVEYVYGIMDPWTILIDRTWTLVLLLFIIITSAINTVILWSWKVGRKVEQKLQYLHLWVFITTCNNGHYKLFILCKKWKHNPEIISCVCVK